MPSFTSQVPLGKAISVRIIDSTSRISNLPAKFLMGPEIPGFDQMSEIPTWSFLIEHESGRKLLFDLGIPTDWQKMAPMVSNRLTTSGWGIRVEKPTSQILSEHGIDHKNIEAIIWSHWHWDHIGNPNMFPPTTKVIVGDGFKREQLPAYPANDKANVRESDFDGRELVEISFTESNALQIGPFRAVDYFGDGSFYILDTPGHTTGHIAGLARTTTTPDTFIFMGGDLTHHGGELRPSPLMPLPDSIPASHVPELCEHLAYTTACPGAIFEDIQSARDRKPPMTTPFFDPTMGKDIAQAIETIKKTQQADADDNVWYVFAHDKKLFGVVDLFPASANNWKQKGWREKLLWSFLKDFKEAAKQVKAKMGIEGSRL